MEGIDHDGHIVVTVEVFAASLVGANLGGIVVADENHVEILLVVAEVGLGGLADRLAVMGLLLDEMGNLRHARGDRPLGLHVQKIFEGWRMSQARDGQG